jgi:hypothetical protein
MKSRLEDSFFLEPHGYPLEVYFPNGTQEKYPTFFKPYTIDFKDIQPIDLKIFDKKAEENVALSNNLMECESMVEFMKIMAKFSPQAYNFFKYLIKEGILSEETTIDFDGLSDPSRVHSFTTASMPNQFHKKALSNIVLRLIQSSRINRDCGALLFYIREAPTLDQEFFRYFCTTVRHVNINLLIDAQRRTKLIDPTAGQQFSSQALFQTGSAEGKQLFEDFGIPEHTYDVDDVKINLLNRLSKADKGIALMSLVGSEPVFPFAVAPPVCCYRTKTPHGTYPNFFNLCEKHEEEMIYGTEET